MGVAGAAWATVIGQFVSLIVIAVVYFKKGVSIESDMRYLKPERKTLGSIYSIGLPISKSTVNAEKWPTTAGHFFLVSI